MVQTTASINFPPIRLFAPGPFRRRNGDRLTGLAALAGGAARTPPAPTGLIEDGAFAPARARAALGRDLVNKVVEFPPLDFSGAKRLARRLDFAVERMARPQQRFAFGGGAGEEGREIMKADLGPAERDGLLGADRRLKHFKRPCRFGESRFEPRERACCGGSLPARNGAKLEERADLPLAAAQAASPRLPAGVIAASVAKVSAALTDCASVWARNASSRAWNSIVRSVAGLAPRR